MLKVSFLIMFVEHKIIYYYKTISYFEQILTEVPEKKIGPSYTVIDRTLRAQSFTSLMENDRQDINRVSSFSR